MVYTFLGNLKFEKLTGIRRDGELLYVPTEKHLYVKKAERNGGVDYICYQTILLKNKENSKKKLPTCTSRVKVTTDGKCKGKLIPHTNHDNHEAIYKDLKTRNAFLDKVVTVNDVLEGLSVKVSNRDIFTLELAK